MGNASHGHPWSQGSGREFLPAVDLWNAPSKMPPPVLQPASLQAKLPFVIKTEVLIQAQGSLQSFIEAVGCLEWEREMEKLLGGNLRALLREELSEEAKFSLKFVSGVKPSQDEAAAKARALLGWDDCSSLGLFPRWEIRN